MAAAVRKLHSLKGLYWAQPGSYDVVECPRCSVPSDERPKRVTFDGFFIVRCGTFVPSWRHDVPISSACVEHMLSIGPEMGKCPGYRLRVVNPDLLPADECAECGRIDDDMITCAECDTHSYCSRLCESIHRSIHKEWCQRHPHSCPRVDFDEPGVDRDAQPGACLGSRGNNSTRRNRRARRRTRHA